MQNGGGDRPIPRFVRVIITAYYLVSRKELQKRQNGVLSSTNDIKDIDYKQTSQVGLKSRVGKSLGQKQ